MPVALLIRVVFWLWFGAAVVAGHFVVLQRVPPAGVPGIIFGLTALVLYAYFRIAPLRAWVDALDLRSLVLFHLTRFVGIYFLVLYQRGELPRAFAIPGGIGDIIVATLVLPIAFAPLEPAKRYRAISLWNIIGLVDILLVVVTAARINFAAPLQLRALTHLPLSLLPTFLVPLLIATHVIIYLRTLRPPTTA